MKTLPVIDGRRGGDAEHPLYPLYIPPLYISLYHVGLHRSLKDAAESVIKLIKLSASVGYVVSRSTEVRGSLHREQECPVGRSGDITRLISPAGRVREWGTGEG